MYFPSHSGCQIILTGKTLLYLQAFEGRTEEFLLTAVNCNHCKAHPVALGPILSVGHDLPSVQSFHTNNF